MNISLEKATAIAKLARLEITSEQAADMATNMNKILAFMATLGEVDTSRVAPLYSPVEHSAPLRADEVRQELSRAEILVNAPETDGEHFRVPRIVA